VALKALWQMKARNSRMRRSWFDKRVECVFLAGVVSGELALPSTTDLSMMMHAPRFSRFWLLSAAAFGVLALAACGNGPQRAGTTAYHPSMSYGPTGLPQGSYPAPGQGPASGYYGQPAAPVPVPMAAPQQAVADLYPAGMRTVRVSGAPPAIRAESYLLIDARTGAHLASRNPDQRRAVASTQKLVTALVVLDAGNLDRTVTIQSTDAQVEPTRLGLAAGQRYTRRNLLYAVLVKSANDVAKALARDNAGSSAAFASRMNAKMRQLGGTSSNFLNPHGLTESGQYSTARNMARVAMAAYRNPVIRDAVSRRYYKFTFNSGKSVTLQNTNKLLGSAGCNGMKTGYTVASGRCLISSASAGGRDVILVQLGTKTQYIFNDARTLMSWGLRQLGANVAEAGVTEDQGLTAMAGEEESEAQGSLVDDGELEAVTLMTPELAAVLGR
jgi:D-alanyl-D-alanine carboxypeptidase (penicillin-binding protein 5/6)